MKYKKNVYERINFLKSLELHDQESDRSSTVNVEGHSLLKGQFRALQRKGVLPATTLHTV